MASVKDILNLSSQDVAKMTRKELAKTVSQLASAGNKRLRRLEKIPMGTESRAYQSAIKVGNFSVSGKNQGQLQQEFKRVSNFLKAKTSSVSGWRRERKKVIERIGGEFPSEESEKDFWKAYREIASSERALHNAYGSDMTQRYLHNELNNNRRLSEREKQLFRELYPDENRDLDHISAVDKATVRTLIEMGEYYESQQGENDEFSDFFTIEEDDL